MIMPLHSEAAKAAEQSLRATIVRLLLECCDDKERLLFKRMYTRDCVASRPIEEVVATMPSDKLDWAAHQIENTIKKKSEKLQGP